MHLFTTLFSNDFPDMQFDFKLRSGRKWTDIIYRHTRTTALSPAYQQQQQATIRYSSLLLFLAVDTIRDAMLTCARKPTRVSLIYRTEPTTKV